MLTNTNIANLYLKDVPVDKLMLGHTQVWPTEPMLAFDLYPSGDKIEFEVVSDTQFIACTIDDSDIYLFDVSSSPKTQIKVDRPGANSQTINIGSSYVVPVQIPLFKKDIIRVTGRGSNRSRYVSDHKSGKIEVRIESKISEVAEVFSVSVTGRGTQTRTTNPNSHETFNFSGLSSGTKIITVRSESTGEEFTTQVYINLIRTTFQPQSKTLRAKGIYSDSGGDLMRVKVYSITEEEAIRNYQEAYGAEASINVETRRLYNKMRRSRDHEVTEVFFKIVNSGWGYPPNTRMRILVRDLGTRHFNGKADDHFVSNWVWCYLVTDKYGRVVDINDNGYRMGSYSQANGYFLLSNLFMEEDIHHYGYGHDDTSNFDHVFANHNYGMYQSQNAWQLTQSRNVLWDYWYSTAINSFWYEAADIRLRKNVYFHVRPPGTNLSSSITNLIDSGKIVVPEAQAAGKHINITYGNLGINTGITGTWFKNLIFDNFDDLGHIKALHLGNNNIERVIVTSQQQLHVVQSDKFGGGTTTGAVGNGKIQIKNSAEYEYTHGLGITYTYQ